MSKGRIIVNTGDGKGKTTAAFGTALRAAGHGQQVAIVQFIKGSWNYGEVTALENCPNVDLRRIGSGFTWEADDPAGSPGARPGGLGRNPGVSPPPVATTFWSSTSSTTR